VSPLTVSDVPDDVTVASAAPEPVYLYVTEYDVGGGPVAGAVHESTPDVVFVHEMDGEVGAFGSVGLVESSVAADALVPYVLTALMLKLYAVPAVSPLTLSDVPDDVTVASDVPDPVYL
jgi:hypothetical protein